LQEILSEDAVLATIERVKDKLPINMLSFVEVKALFQ